MPTDRADITSARERIAAHWRQLVARAGGATVVSRRLGITIQALHRWTSGLRLPQPEQWPEFANALEVSTCDEFFPPGLLAVRSPEKNPQESKKGA